MKVVDLTYHENINDWTVRCDDLSEEDRDELQRRLCDFTFEQNGYVPYFDHKIVITITNKLVGQECVVPAVMIDTVTS